MVQFVRLFVRQITEFNDRYEILFGVRVFGLSYYLFFITISEHFNEAKPSRLIDRIAHTISKLYYCKSI